VDDAAAADVGGLVTEQPVDETPEPPLRIVLVRVLVGEVMQPAAALRMRARRVGDLDAEEAAPAARLPDGVSR
jgi:hypothetical protein